MKKIIIWLMLLVLLTGIAYAIPRYAVCPYHGLTMKYTWRTRYDGDTGQIQYLFKCPAGDYWWLYDD